MRFELLEFRTAEPPAATTVCRITALGIHWRVVVESHRDGGVWVGRLVFEPEAPATRYEPRYGPFAFRGGAQEAILDAAHQIPERRLLDLLHSLG